jgi:hypothetical protein
MESPPGVRRRNGCKHSMRNPWLTGTSAWRARSVRTRVHFQHARHLGLTGVGTTSITRFPSPISRPSMSESRARSLINASLVSMDRCHAWSTGHQTARRPHRSGRGTHARPLPGHAGDAPSCRYAIGIGAPVALFATKLVASLLFGLSSNDPASLLMIAGLAG